MTHQYEGSSALRLFDTSTMAALEAELPDIPIDYVPEVLPATEERLVIEVDRAKTEEVLGRLLKALHANEYPYNQDRVMVAQDARNMPDTLVRGSRDHAMFLFNACYYMRGAIKSNNAIRWMARVYDDIPDLFDCAVARSVEPSTLATILDGYGLSFDKDAVSRHWVENAKRLLYEYDGDPRNIFEHVDSYEQSLLLIQNDRKGGGFKGFQEKMTSMLTYYLRAEELVDQSYNFPIPIDFHAMRVSIANEMITFSGAPNGTNLYTEQTAEVLRDLYAEYAATHNVNPLALSDAVWLLSESTCSRAPGNKTRKLRVKDADGEENSIFMPARISPDSQADRAAYMTSCGKCPLGDICRHNIPSAYYYNGKHLIIRGDRHRFPLPDSVVRLPLDGTMSHEEG